MKVLYLGLRPKAGTYHYPVIRTEFCADLAPALALWDQFTHIIFTSQTAVEYWPGPWNKKTLAIGEKTAEALWARGIQPDLAPYATQEGIAERIFGKTGYFFIPRSRRARPFLEEFFNQQKIPHFFLDLYDTLFQKLEPVPPLDEFEEIVFTSPSTVEGFLQIYGKIPSEKKLTSIGPITEKRLRDQLNSEYSQRKGVFYG